MPCVLSRLLVSDEGSSVKAPKFVRLANKYQILFERPKLKPFKGFPWVNG